MSNIITKAIKILNEDYETLERVPGDPVVNTVMGKAKEDAEEAAKAVEKVMHEVSTPDELKEPKMPKTKDLKDMGLVEQMLNEEEYEEEKENEEIIEFLNENSHFFNYLNITNMGYIEASGDLGEVNGVQASLYFVYDDDGYEVFLGISDDDEDSLDEEQLEALSSTMKYYVPDYNFVATPNYGDIDVNYVVYTEDDLDEQSSLDILNTLLNNTYSLTQDFYDIVSFIPEDFDGESLVLNEMKGEDFFNKEVHGKLDGIENPTLQDYIDALENR